MENNPYQEGYDAFKAGEPISRNPYPGDPESYEHWQDGYIAAELDAGQTDNQIEE